MAIVKKIEARACNVVHAGKTKWKADDDDDSEGDRDGSSDSSRVGEYSSSSPSATAGGASCDSDLIARASSFALSLIAAAITDHSRFRTAVTEGISSSSHQSKPSSPTTGSPSMLLHSLPKDVLANDVLGFLTDKAVKKFLDSLGERRLSSSSFSELAKRFCTKHGSRLEDPSMFHHLDGEPHGSTPGTPMPKPTDSLRRSCCPECYAEQQHTKRCHGCRVFFPRHDTGTDGPASNNTPNNKGMLSKGGPGLWCQTCDRLAFCNACLSNDTDGCGSIPVPAASLSAFGAFGQKRKFRGHGHNHKPDGKEHEPDRMHYCNSHRITCHNYCCPNVFTNTMCGEFVCDDCGDDQHRLLAQQRQKAAHRVADDHDHYHHDTPHEPSSMSIETCDECGKATCLDTNCLVCADFRLIHMSCSFCPEDAYRFDLGDILLGRGKNYRKSCSAESSTKLRRIVSDLVLLSAVLCALSKM